MLITAAPLPRSEEAQHRLVGYLFTMGVRAVCFLIAVVVPVPAVRIAAIVGACVLPYIAVVFANTVRRLDAADRPAYYLPQPTNQLPAGVGARDRPDDD